MNCPTNLILNGVSQDLNTPVKYDGEKTPTLSAVNPRFGTVKGGSSIIFTGTKFSTTPTDYKILIDEIECTVTAATATTVTCTTGKRPGLPKPSLSFFIKDKGNASIKDVVFTYVNLWSDATTWGGEFQPVDGEMVYIPAGLNLMVDIKKSPLLKAVLVEG
jgi:hypothetical protein